MSCSRSLVRRLRLCVPAEEREREGQEGASSGSTELQAELLQLLQRGASMAAACRQLRIPLAKAAKWVLSPALQTEVAQVRSSLSQNVAAALYRAAMEGNVTAQNYYLKLFPPPNWLRPDDPDGESDPFQNFTDDELVERCRALGIDLPLEALGGDGPEADAAQPR